MVKNPPAIAGDAGDTGSIPEGGRSPGKENGNPLQYSCLGKSHGQRSLMGYSPWNCKSQTQLGNETTTNLLLLFLPVLKRLNN